MFKVIKTINGRRYWYSQTSKRIGKKVKTTSTYIGPVEGAISLPEAVTTPDDRFLPDTLPAAERREDERIRYGGLKARKIEQKAAVRKAKRKSSGTGAINPFIGKLLKGP